MFRLPPVVLSAFALLALVAPVAAQSQAAAAAGDLPRHGIIGLVVAPVDPSKPGDAATNPPAVRIAVPGGAGASAGIEPRDIIRELDGHVVANATDFASGVGRHLAGDTLTIKIVRAGAEMEMKAVLQPRPFEKSADADVLYSYVTAGGSRRRTIVTHPKTPGHYPALLLMGGLGCYSLDGALVSDANYGPLLAAFVKRNYVTMRVEKTGEGDSDEPACTSDQATAELEAQGYVAALASLRSDAFVDASKIFVFAHSLGPLIAAIALPGQPQLRGIIVAETIGRSWFEYGTENVRRQSALVGEPLDEVDDAARHHSLCAAHYFLMHEDRDAVIKLGSQCRDMIASYAGMSDPYMHQIGDINIARAWKQIDAPTLVIYGLSDPVTSADESRYLVTTINSFHPGRATYSEIPAMAHDFAEYDSPAAFLNRKPGTKGLVSQTFLKVVMDWIAEQSRS